MEIAAAARAVSRVFFIMTCLLYLRGFEIRG
jgi:hypothetical protein